MELSSNSRDVIDQKLQDLKDASETSFDRAFEELANYLEKRLMMLAHRLLSRFSILTEATGDIYGDASLKLVRMLREQRTTVENWESLLKLATRIMRNHLIDLARKCKAKLVSQMNSDSSDGNVLDRVQESNQDLDRLIDLHEALPKLPEAEQEIIDLIYFQGLNRTQIQRKKGYDRRTTNDRWTKAIRNLSKLLDGNSPNHSKPVGSTEE